MNFLVDFDPEYYVLHYYRGKSILLKRVLCSYTYKKKSISYSLHLENTTEIRGFLCLLVLFLVCYLFKKAKCSEFEKWKSTMLPTSLMIFPRLSSSLWLIIWHDWKPFYIFVKVGSTPSFWLAFLHVLSFFLFSSMRANKVVQVNLNFKGQG